MDFKALSYFQFDNLVRTRTQFLFINYSEDLRSWFGPLEKMHLDIFERRWPSESIFAELEASRVPKEYAIVILCEDGEKSKELANSLANSGYINTYYIKDGYQGLLNEKGVGSST